MKAAEKYVGAGHRPLNQQDLDNRSFRWIQAIPEEWRFWPKQRNGKNFSNRSTAVRWVAKIWRTVKWLCGKSRLNYVNEYSSSRLGTRR